MKPEGPCFDAAWRAQCDIKSANRRKVSGMIEAHYLGQWPKQIQLVLGLYRGDKILGVIVFSEVCRELASRFGQETWELSRLWIMDQVPQNAESFFIARAIRHIKRHHRNLRQLISFADPKHGHSGVIYKASNWTAVEHNSKHLFTYPL